MFDSKFVTKHEDLVTTHEARRTGFLENALARNDESIDYLDRAKALYTQLKQHTTKCEDILAMSKFKTAFLDAAGFAAKARSCLSENEQQYLLAEFVTKVIKPTGAQYIDEIVYRYLMALGEQLGGHMRNEIGKIAQAKFTRYLIAQLKLSESNFQVHKKNGEWLDGSTYKLTMADEIKAIRWKTNGFERMLIYNLTVPGIGGRNKNVDIVVFNCHSNGIDKKSLDALMQDSKTLHLMGELKGGIDPAGADEHWKTARGALERIRSTYKKAYVIFVGAAIEVEMSKEIFNQWQSGMIDYAANLTNEDQLSALCGWLIEQ